MINASNNYSSSATENDRMNDTGIDGHDKNKKRRRQIGGAAALGGITGLVVVGPVVGLVAAGGAAILAANNRNKIGDVARASGDMTASVGSKIGELEQRHHIGQKAANGVIDGCSWVSKKLKSSRA